MPHVDDAPAAPGAICPPVPALPGGQATVAGFADVHGIPGESVAKGHEHQVDIVPLVEACATGRHIERVLITLERGAKPAFAFLVVELEDVVVTRVNSSWSGGLPDEEVAFGFGKVCWEYRRAPGTAPVRFCFDLASNSRA